MNPRSGSGQTEKADWKKEIKTKTIIIQLIEMVCFTTGKKNSYGLNFDIHNTYKQYLVDCTRKSSKL